MTTIGFADNDDEARDRFELNSIPDPFPDIPPALLNSADIYDYVQKVGMVFPFDPTPEHLKSASYEVPFLGSVIYWNEGKRFESEIENGTIFPLKKNSIAFVWPKTTFRLPDYIALRFNFRITHVHRGLLLGTGPLIDPGFAGRILIPVHNLTSEDYELVGGAGLIWVEFTKVSPNEKWDLRSDRSSKNFHGFPAEKRYQQPHYYFEKASNNQPIQSSIPGEVKKSKNDAEAAKDDAEAAKISADAAKKSVDTVKNRIFVVSIIALLALGITLAGVVNSIFALISDTNTRFDGVVNRLSTLEAKSDAKPVPVDSLRPMGSDSAQPRPANVEAKSYAKPSTGGAPHPTGSSRAQSGPTTDVTRDRVHQDKKPQ